MVFVLSVRAMVGRGGKPSRLAVLDVPSTCRDRDYGVIYLAPEPRNMSKNPVAKNITIIDEKDSYLKKVGGSDRTSFNNRLITSAVYTAWLPKDQPDDLLPTVVDTTVFAMTAFKPTDEIEGMIAAQAMAMHYASMECSRRAMIPDQPSEAAQAHRKAAANSSRAFVALLDALDRKRGKGGQQRVIVEHVHVHAGGKAIVGSVNQSSGDGGGVAGETPGEPHTPPPALEHDTALGTVLPPMRGKNAEREALPVSSHAERKMPDARRRKHRTTNGCGIGSDQICPNQARALHSRDD
jgi:hypothetical protein